MALLGVPFDGTSGGHPRQAGAPSLLRQALGLTDGRHGGVPVWDVGDVRTEPVDVLRLLERTRGTLDAVHRRAPDALPVLLGGEHTISLAAVESLDPASIVSLDAHPDLWDEQHGRRLAQGTWLRRAAERLDAELVLPWARAARGEEWGAIEELGIRTEIPPDLPEPVYISVDVDVFDPSDAPAVVWPEPGGPSPREVIDLVSKLAEARSLAGVDLVEVNAARAGPTVRLGARVIQSVIEAQDRDEQTEPGSR